MGPVACRVANPPAQGVSSLRTSLVPGLLDVARRNFLQRAPGVGLFEIGRVFTAGDDGGPTARPCVRAACSPEGCRPPPGGPNSGRWISSTSRGLSRASWRGSTGSASNPPKALPGARETGAASASGTVSWGPWGRSTPALGARFDIDGTPISLSLSFRSCSMPGRSGPSPSARSPGFPRSNAIWRWSSTRAFPPGGWRRDSGGGTRSRGARRPLRRLQGGPGRGGQAEPGLLPAAEIAERTLEDGDAEKVLEDALETLRGAFGARLRQTGTPRRP